MVSMPHWPKYIFGRNSIKYDLGRMSDLIKVLKSPHLSLPPVIHIAGTNGKGSTASYLKAIFAAADYTAHVYTSPHLIEFNERIVISGEKISDAYLFQLVERVRIASEKHNIEPSFFEAITAVAFLGFAEKKADVLILETGIGGRLDATNIVEKPLISIITPVSLDHVNYLGPGIENIAYEKAGIIKNGTPCVVSHQFPTALDIILKMCHTRNVESIVYQSDFGIQKMADGFKFLSQKSDFDLPMPALMGDHQILNSATVIAALELAQQVFSFSKKHFFQGLKNATWPARIQKIATHKYRNFVSEKNQIWLDGAHNDHGAKVLANWIQDELLDPVILIVGITKNRDVVSFLSQFKGYVQTIFTVPVESEPLSYPAQILSQKAKAADIETIPCLCLEDALTKISNDSFEGNIIITGSLFLASDFFKLIGVYSL